MGKLDLAKEVVKKVVKKPKRKYTYKQVKGIRDSKISAGDLREGKQYKVPVPTKRYKTTPSGKTIDKFKQFRRVVFAKRRRKNPLEEFEPGYGEPSKRTEMTTTYNKKPKKPDYEFESYNKGGIRKGKDFVKNMEKLKKIYGGKIPKSLTIEEADKALKNLMITETEQRTRPKYEVSYPQSGIAGSVQKPPTYTSELPKGARQTSGMYGQQFYQVPIKNYTSMGQQNMSPQYRRIGDEKYTVSTTRAQKAGDEEYDKQFTALQRLQKRHDNRFLYHQYQPSKGLTGQNVYSNIGLSNTQSMQPKPFVNPYASYGTSFGTAKKGGAVKMSKGGKAAIRGKRFTGVY